VCVRAVFPRKIGHAGAGATDEYLWVPATATYTELRVSREGVPGVACPLPPGRRFGHCRHVRVKALDVHDSAVGHVVQ
jgi:hypothetical protein